MKISFDVVGQSVDQCSVQCTAEVVFLFIVTIFIPILKKIMLLNFTNIVAMKSFICPSELIVQSHSIPFIYWNLVLNSVSLLLAQFSWLQPYTLVDNETRGSQSYNKDLEFLDFQSELVLFL